MSAVFCSVIIPAHNEAAVIRRTLHALFREASASEFEVIVVCNGCTDDTAEVVRCAYPDVRVVELSEASKISALNAGFALVTRSELLLLDADVELPTKDARTLVEALNRPGVDAAIGRMQIDAAGASWLVRAFYRVWLLHPYLENGKFAAVIALSKTTADKIWPLPQLIADDSYLRRRITSSRVALADAKFTVRVPRSLVSLIRTRSRSYRGTSELKRFAPISRMERSSESLGLMTKLLRKPSSWLLLPVYVAVTVVAKLAALRSSSGWERDATTRGEAETVS